VGPYIARYGTLNLVTHTRRILDEKYPRLGWYAMELGELKIRSIHNELVKCLSKENRDLFIDWSINERDT
jgi:hypothetical protein